MKTFLGIAVLALGFVLSCGQAGESVQRPDAVQKAIQTDSTAAGGYCDERRPCGFSEECRNNHCVGV